MRIFMDDISEMKLKAKLLKRFARVESSLEEFETCS
jgi:hypothetical protein